METRIMRSSNTLCVFAALVVSGCSTIDNQFTGQGSKNPFTAHLPKTVSQEARALLTRAKGDIISNYLLDEQGNYVLPDRHRKAAPNMKVEAVKYNGVRTFWFSSEKASATHAVVVYLHGGGYVEGSGNEDGGIIFPVYEEMGVRGLSVDYRLAPQHPFPAAVEDAKNVFLGLLQEGYQPSQIALVGDSAGGCLALATTLALKQEGRPLPAAIVAISPGVMDMEVFGDTYTTLAEWDPFEKPSQIYANIDKYAGETRRDHPLMSPLYADYRGFPPLLIQVGTRDLLLSDSVRLARKARKSGVDITLDVWDGMWHVWHMTWPDVPEAREACHEIALFLKRHLDLSGST